MSNYMRAVNEDFGENTEVEKDDKERIFESESAYRRGYLHGYDSAIDDIKETGIEKVIKFFDRRLTQWRFGQKPYKNCDELDLPPVCNE